MVRKLYIGNLAFTVTEEAIRTLFAAFGEVVSVNLIKDLHSGRARGFGFVEMENAEEAAAQLNGKEFEGRAMKVDIARERPERTFGGYGGRGRGGDRHGRSGGGGGGGGYGGRRNY